MQQLKTKCTANLDLDLIVERLQADGVLNCDRIPKSEVKYALIHWANKLIESINEDPDWWIIAHFQKEFRYCLPEPSDHDPDFQDESELKEFVSL